MTNRRNARLTSSLVVVASSNPSRSKHDDEEEATMTSSSSSSTRDPSTIDRRIDRSFNRVVIAPQRLAREDVENARGGHARATCPSVCIYVCSLGHSDHKESHHIQASYQSDTHTESRVYTPPPRSTDCVFVSSRLRSNDDDDDDDDDDDFKLSSSRRRRLDVSVRRAETTT